MKNGLLILPFLAVLILAATEAVGSAMAEHSTLISAIGYVLTAGIIIAWIALDRHSFKSFFTRKGFKYGASSGGIVALVFASLIILAYVTQQATFNKKLDVTENKISSLEDQSVELITKFKDADARVVITGYFLSPEIKADFERLIQLYQGYGAPFDLDFVDIKTNPDQVAAAGLSSENTAIFDYEARTSRITDFTEEEITNVLLNVLKKDSKTVYFLQGHGEPAISADDNEGFSIAAKELDKQKIMVKDISLFAETKIPEDADVIVIAAPQYDLNEAELNVLDEYLSDGGAVVVSVAPAVELPKLSAWVTQYGLKIGEDILLMDQRDPRTMFFGKTSVVVSDFNSMNGITKKFSAEGDSRRGVQLILPLARSVSAIDSSQDDLATDSQNYQAEIIAKTANFILKFDGITSQEDLGAGLDAATASSGNHGIIGLSKLDLPEDAAAETQAPGQLLVAGSSHVFSNHAMRQHKTNRDFMGAIVAYLTRDNNFVSIPIKEFAKADIDLTSGASLLFYKLIVWLYPFLILGATVLYWQIRKRNAA